MGLFKKENCCLCGGKTGLFDKNVLNDGAVQIHNIGRRLWTDPGRKLAAHLLGLPGLVKEKQAAVYDNDSLLHAFMRSDYEMPDYSYGFKCSPFNWEEIRRYQYYLAMAREIQTIITEKGECKR